MLLNVVVVVHKVVEPLGMQPIDYQADQSTTVTTVPLAVAPSTTVVTANKDNKDEGQKKDPDRPLIAVSLKYVAFAFDKIRKETEF